jgi:hypothetical protein
MPLFWEVFLNCYFDLVHISQRISCLKTEVVKLPSSCISFKYGLDIRIALAPSTQCSFSFRNGHYIARTEVRQIWFLSCYSRNWFRNIIRRRVLNLDLFVSLLFCETRDSCRPPIGPVINFICHVSHLIVHQKRLDYILRPVGDLHFRFSPFFSRKYVCSKGQMPVFVSPFSALPRAAAFLQTFLNNWASWNALAVCILPELFLTFLGENMWSNIQRL